MVQSEKTMEQRMVKALVRTFDVISADLFEVNGGKDMRRSEVFELASDCYLEMYGDDKEAIEEFRKLSDTAKKKIGKLAFPYARYGR